MKRVNEAGKNELPLLKLNNRITISDERMSVDTPAQLRAPKIGRACNGSADRELRLAIA